MEKAKKLWVPVREASHGAAAIILSSDGRVELQAGGGAAAGESAVCVCIPSRTVPLGACGGSIFSSLIKNLLTLGLSGRSGSLSCVQGPSPKFPSCHRNGQGDHYVWMQFHVLKQSSGVGSSSVQQCKK